MAVALNDLRCDRGWFQVKPCADLFLDIGADVGESSDCARDLPDTQVFRSCFETPLITACFFIPDGELQAKGDGLGMDAMRAADLDSVLELECAAFEHFAQLREAGQ